MIRTDIIYNEDCLDTLSRIPSDYVDCVVTSPPYNMNLRIRNGQYCSRQIVKEFSTKYNGFADNLPVEEYNQFHTKVLTELLRVSKVIFYNVQIVTGSKRSVFKMIGDFTDYLKDIIIWDKGVAQPSMQEKVINRRAELILVFEKDYPISRQYRYAQFKRGTLADIWQIKREPNSVIGRTTSSSSHGATFPEKLVETILENFTQPKDVIYDPFMGTGTTAVVSKKMDRHYIGSEINPEYCRIGKNRLKNLSLPLEILMKEK
ncbi:MAG: site-specific DNA-methyltransferase [Flavobacteriaceae bacterium]|nr:site-specific DNA-methyltransferase [Flavobacteriaceae bacterium]